MMRQRRTHNRRSKRRAKVRGKAARQRVSDKVRVLRDENIPQRQAVAEALSMERAHKLRKGGVYLRAHGKKRKSKRG